MMYQDIVKPLYSEAAGACIPSGTALSRAMVCLRDGRLAHRFFTYTLEFPTTKGVAPLSTIDLDAKTGEILNHTQCREKAHAIDAALLADKATTWKGIKTYEALYPEIVALFEKGDLTQDERKTVRALRDAFDQFVSPDLKEIYMQMAPEMFEFMNLA